MPLLYNDPLLGRLPLTDPAKSDYAGPVTTQSIASLTRDLRFRSIFEPHQDLGMNWIRNLRQWDHSTLDVVKCDSPNPIARKRITSFEHDAGSVLAMNEAEILRSVKHRHIVQLYSTYRQGEIWGLLFDPAAEYDLRSFMELAEIKNIHRPIDVQRDNRLLIESFGCLAGAVASVHEAGYDHGDIRPENILIHEARIFLSKFSLGLQSEGNGHRRFIDLFGRLDVGRRSRRSSFSGSSRPEDPAAVSIIALMLQRFRLIPSVRDTTNLPNGDLKRTQPQGNPVPIYSALGASSSKCIQWFKAEDFASSKNFGPMKKDGMSIATTFKKH